MSSMVFQTAFTYTMKMGALDSKNTRNEETTISNGLRPIISVGRILGVISSPDLFSKASDRNPSKLKRISVLLQRVYSLSLGIYFFVGVILRLKVSADKYGSYLSIGQRINLLISMGASGFSNFLVYLYLIPKTSNLRVLIRRLSDVSMEINSDIKTNRNHFWSYPSFCLVVAAFIMLYGTAENFMYHFQGLKGLMNHTDVSTINSKVMELFYYDRFTFLGDYVPTYHPIASIFFFVACNMYGLLSWIYVDVLVVVLCRSLTELLHMFKESVEQSYVFASKSVMECNENESETSVEIWWGQIRNRYMALMSLVEDMGRFLSPLFMICYGMNVYYIINNLFKWISPNRPENFSEDLFYNYFAFTSFVLRVFSVTYFGTEVYHTGNSILKTLQRLPDSIYTFSVERLERTMISSPCGIYLFDTILLSRGFFVSLIGFIFSVEIMMLQADNGK